jgi:hypothetical protein
MRDPRAEIKEIVDRETLAWDTRNVELLLTVLHPDMVFFTFDWRLARPFRFSTGHEVTPVLEMFNTFNNANNINPLSTPALFNFDGFLRTGGGDPRQVQLAVKFTF